MVSKYVTNLHPPRLGQVPSCRSQGDVVILVGTTGAVGSHTLATLLKDGTIAHVYALNRKNVAMPLSERQAASFEERGLTDDLLTDPKLTLLEADFAVPQLGFDEAAYNKVRAFCPLSHPKQT